MVSTVISSGHGLKVRGASCPPPGLDEVNEARKVVNRVGELLRAGGHSCVVFHDDTSTSVNQNLSTIVNFHNSKQRDRDISIHFNAYSKTSSPMGTESLYVSDSQASLAGTIASSMSKAAGFKNRGPKKRTDLYFLNKTAKPAHLLEVCFVDSYADADLYRASFENLCRAIAESVASVKLEGTEPPPIDPPVDPSPPEVTGKHVLEIIATAAAGNPTVIVNDEMVREGDKDAGTVDVSLRIEGDVVVSINGEVFDTEEPDESVFDTNHQQIICSVFGGKADPNDSAYAPYDAITDQELSCALPWKFAGDRPLVLVRNRANHKEVICQIRDVGPWVTDDSAYVLGDDRPLAEPKGSKIPRGKHKGKTSNGAGLDLTPAAAKAIGLSGMGEVDWRFVDQPPTS